MSLRGGWLQLLLSPKQRSPPPGSPPASPWQQQVHLPPNPGLSQLSRLFLERVLLKHVVVPPKDHLSGPQTLGSQNKDSWGGGHFLSLGNSFPFCPCFQEAQFQPRVHWWVLPAFLLPPLMHPHLNIHPTLLHGWTHNEEMKDTQSRSWREGRQRGGRGRCGGDTACSASLPSEEEVEAEDLQSCGCRGRGRWGRGLSSQDLRSPQTLPAASACGRWCKQGLRWAQTPSLCPLSGQGSGSSSWGGGAAGGRGGMRTDR